MVEKLLLLFIAKLKLLDQIDTQAKTIIEYQHSTCALKVKVHDLKTIIYIQEISLQMTHMLEVERLSNDN